MQRSTSLSAGAVLCAALLGLSLPAQATYSIVIQQVGANVTVTGTGSINTTSLPLFAQATIGPSLNPTLPGLIFGSSTMDIYLGFPAAPAAFGTGGSATASTAAGASVAFQPNLLFVPQGYVSGAALSSSMSFTNKTLAGMGITPGTYTYAFGSGVNQDSIVLTAIAPAPPAAASIPTLSEWALLGLSSLVALMGLGWLRRRRPA